MLGTIHSRYGSHHSGTGEEVKLTYAHRLFGQDRETVDEAYPGDVVGLVGHPDFKIGDTLSEDPKILYNEIPRFPPECFVYLHNSIPSKSKQFRKGLDQLLREGIVQTFTLQNAANVAPLLAAVGPLQFEVVQYRLESEYGIQTRLEPAPWKLIRWVDEPTLDAFMTSHPLPSGVKMGQDQLEQPVIFFPEEWGLRSFCERNPQFRFQEVAPQDQSAMQNLSKEAGTVS